MIKDFQNSINHYYKKFESLSEFKELEEFPETKCLVIVDLGCHTIYSNYAFQKTFKLKEDESFLKLETEPDLLNVLENFSNSKFSSFHFDLSIPLRIEASFFYVEIERILIENLEYFLLILTNQDERTRLENKINSLHNALEYGNIPVIMTDSQGKINYSTRSFERILKTSIENLYNQSIVSELQKFLDPSEADDLQLRISEGEKSIKIISDIDATGSLWFRELIVNPVYKTEDNSLSFIITANDITDYVLKNRLIRKSEAKQKSIINNISDLLLIIRRENDSLIFENANDNFYETFEVDRNLAGDTTLEQVIEEYFYRILTAILNVESTAEPGVKEFRYKNYLNNKEYIGHITFTTDHYENQKIFIVSLRDITEQLKTEEQLRKAYERETHINKLKSSFLANMSHEIRTPLNAIVGYSELIEDDVRSGSNESALELFAYLKEGYSRLVSLVDNIMEMTLIQSGEAEIELNRTDASEIIDLVHAKMKPSADGKGIQLNVNIWGECQISVDKKKLTKIIMELVDNAIKYNEHNGSVWIRAEAKDEFIRISIQDTGKGIKEEQVNRMLEPFTQEDEGHKREYEGAGLGLTIAYNLTKLMNGTFNVQTEKNKGTQITLAFKRV